MMLMQDVILIVMKSWSGDDPRAKSLAISYLDNIGLYTATTMKMPINIREAGSFEKKQVKLAILTH